MNIDKIQIPKDTIKKIRRKIDGNDFIASYYDELGKEEQNVSFLRQAENVRLCFKVWDTDKYFFQQVKDIKHINCCKNKFCLNCQGVAANRRYAKYSPILTELEKTFDVYHIVFTVPNCKDDVLNCTLDRMYKKFVYVIQYMQGKRKAKHIDFLKYGFVGAIRSLEITTKRKNGINDYHPHFHCLFIFKKGIREEKKHLNDFSYSNKNKKVRKFTDLEILLQKSWYLFYNDDKLTAKGLESLLQGYSVTADKSNGKYHEVFKYAIKGSFKDGTIYHYDVFKTLYYALYRRKIIQGYGILNKFDFEDDTIKERADEIYEEIIRQLKLIEDPTVEHLTFKDVCNDFENSNYRYISKRQIIKELREEC